MNLLDSYTKASTHTPLRPEVIIAPAVIWQSVKHLADPDLILIDSAAEPNAFSFITGKQIILAGSGDDAATIVWNDWLCKEGATFIPLRSTSSHWLIGPLAGLTTNICLHDLKLQTALNGFPELFSITTDFDSATAPHLFPAMADFWPSHTAQDLLYTVYAVNFQGRVAGQTQAARFPHDEVCRAPLPPRRIHYAQQLIPHESHLPR